MNVRIMRKINDLKSFWGGDDFHVGDNRTPTPGFTTSGIQPELIIDNISYFNIGRDAFPNNALKRAKTTYEFFSNKQPQRENIYKAAHQRYSLKNHKITYASKNIEKFPSLIQGLIGLEEYYVRDELFDKTFLHKLTGLKY